MFYDVQCFSLMFYGVLWCSKMFYDVLWGSMMFGDNLVLWCSMMLWCSLMFYDVLCLKSILGFLLSEHTSGVSPVIFKMITILQNSLGVFMNICRTQSPFFWPPWRANSKTDSHSLGLHGYFTRRSLICAAKFLFLAQHPAQPQLAQFCNQVCNYSNLPTADTTCEALISRCNVTHTKLIFFSNRIVADI